MRTLVTKHTSDMRGGIVPPPALDRHATARWSRRCFLCFNSAGVARCKRHREHYLQLASISDGDSFDALFESFRQERRLVFIGRRRIKSLTFSKTGNSPKVLFGISSEHVWGFVAEDTQCHERRSVVAAIVAQKFASEVNSFSGRVFQQSLDVACPKSVIRMRRIGPIV